METISVAAYDRLNELNEKNAQRILDLELTKAAADALVIECRSSVRLDLENYERVIDDMDRSDQQMTAAYEAVSKERTRLFRLLANIDALTTPNTI